MEYFSDFVPQRAVRPRAASLTSVCERESRLREREEERKRGREEERKRGRERERERKREIYVRARACETRTHPPRAPAAERTAYHPNP